MRYPTRQLLGLQFVLLLICGSAHAQTEPGDDPSRFLADPQVRQRDMKIEMPCPGIKDGKVDLIGNPIKFSQTPVQYRRPPPTLGQDTDQVLGELLDLGPEEIAALRDKGVI